MKGYIHYVKGHSQSEQQAAEALASFIKFGWDVSLRAGYTPETLPDSEYDYKCIEGGRLEGMLREGRGGKIKKACISNQIRLWREVVETNEPMAFIEHDAICIGKGDYIFDEILCYNIEYAFQPPSVLGTLANFRGYKAPLAMSPRALPKDYPLKYYKNTVYKDYLMIPGTAAYAITPKGAKRLLRAAEHIGIDQSDFFINTYNVNIEYLSPSPTRFNSKNLNLSHKL